MQNNYQPLPPLNTPPALPHVAGSEQTRGLFACLVAEDSAAVQSAKQDSSAATIPMGPLLAGLLRAILHPNMQARRGGAGRLCLLGWQRRSRRPSLIARRAAAAVRDTRRGGSRTHNAAHYCLRGQHWAHEIKGMCVRAVQVNFGATHESRGIVGAVVVDTMLLFVPPKRITTLNGNVRCGLWEGAGAGGGSVFRLEPREAARSWTYLTNRSPVAGLLCVGR